MSWNGGNIIKIMNTWDVTAVRHTAGILDLTEEELKNMDRKTRKVMTMDGALHPKADIDGLFGKKTWRIRHEVYRRSS